jgi:hypothetical protein
VGTTRLALVPGPTEPRDLILQNRGGDPQAQFLGQGRKGFLHQVKQLVTVHRDLDSSVGLW